jgi:hypothetical protein
LSDTFDTDDKEVPRPPIHSRYTEDAKVSSFFIRWPVSIEFDTLRSCHGCLGKFKRIFNLWPLGNMLLPLAAANLALNSVTVLVAP